MLRQIFMLSAALALVNTSAHAQRPSDLVNKRIAARVVAVVDGDTVDIVIPPGRRLRVRLHGVDTPESGQPFGQEARIFTRVLMFGRDVEVAGKDVDVYDRLVARIAVDKGDASETIIAAGLGCTFRRYVSDAALDAAQDRARTARLGFWAAGARQPPCVAREANAKSTSKPRNRVTGGVVANVNSKVYHLQTCPNANCKSCTRRFDNHADAEAAGFRPARDCIDR
jgi:endonuclease YncB( thermonuclease family)